MEIPTRHQSSDDVSPSYEEVFSDNTRLLGRVIELETLVATLEAEVEKLRREHGRHSGNSGRPPSSDTLTQRAEQKEERLSRQERRRLAREKAKKLMEEKPKRRPGKQPGVPRTTLGKVDDPDCVEVHVPTMCVRCGRSLDDTQTVATEVRQVHDLPIRRLEVTEHRAESRRCGCGCVTKAAFPKEARSPACYGPLVRAVAVYLMVAQHLPVARTAALLSEVLGAPVSTGWLAGLAQEATDGLEGFMERLRADLISADVLHADETGARISGARYWFHVACTDLLTLLDCHRRRGAEAFSDMGVLEFFSGVLVTDGWKSYWSIGAFDHALCLSHLLRDLAAVSVEGHKLWADDMADLLVEAKNAISGALAKGKDGIDSKPLRTLRTHSPQMTSPPKTKAMNNPPTMNKPILICRLGPLLRRRTPRARQQLRTLQTGRDQIYRRG